MSYDRRKLGDIPRHPGVYVMKDAQGKVLYVGKAVDLRSRVRSYFREGGDGRPLVPFLLPRIEEIEWVVTASEKEALILENSLIQSLHPRYNVRFRDDKSFFHVRIDPSHPFPRLGLVRRPHRDRALYFGPYDSSRAVRQTLRLLQRYMGLRTCTDSQWGRTTRTCLNHQMGRCAGVCLGKVSREEYGARVQEAILLLQGKSRQLLRLLEERMEAAARDLRFEEAARIRDQRREVERTVEGQRAVALLGSDQDALGLHRVEEGGTLVLLRMRKGKVSEGITFPLRPTPLDDGEVVVSFLKLFYHAQRAIPREILVPTDPGADGPLLEQWLTERAGRRVRIRRPLRGQARGLLEMARQNALSVHGGSQDVRGMAARLGESLRLTRAPRVLEGFDISTLGGEEAVGSAVRFVDGLPERGAYRSYNIRTVAGADDYAMMYELLGRHLRHRHEAGDLPDLLVMDGGKGQLGVALAVLEEMGLRGVEAVALAKGRGREGPRHVAAEDRVFIANRREPVPLGRDAHLLRLLQHVRDEAHRHALTHHRRRRGRRRLRSALDRIPGVGPVRRRRLLQRFGSLRGVGNAGVEELAAVPGMTRPLAKRIAEALKGGDGEDAMQYVGGMGREVEG
jgi:excinuclease ABC subunit C